MISQIINDQQISKTLDANTTCDKAKIKDILKKALELNGLNIDDVAALMSIEDDGLLKDLFGAANTVKETIYGKRLVLFAPMYISNLCSNNCAYCAFRATNTKLKRRALTQDEIAAEVKALIDQGQKRLLLVAGESYTQEGFNYILDSIDTVYGVKSKNGEIRRVNVNIAPLSLADFKLLKAKEIGTYQLFQETYHKEVYSKVHLGGKKRDYDWRITAIDRAMEAGIDDVGIGVLFGLAPWKYEMLALLQHAQYLDKTFGVGPHTLSVPRLEPASGSIIASNPPKPVSDRDFHKIIAILRLAVPYTGIILSTRETPETRRAVLDLGVSQISAASRTNPGGYGKDDENASQFSLGDHRSLEEVVKDVASMGYIPSFCTACYRLGRTGHDFMDLAKPGEIKKYCAPNGLATFTEYLKDYALLETQKVGFSAIEKEMAKMTPDVQKIAKEMVDKVKAGQRDVFV